MTNTTIDIKKMSQETGVPLWDLKIALGIPLCPPPELLLSELTETYNTMGPCELKASIEIKINISLIGLLEFDYPAEEILSRAIPYSTAWIIAFEKMIDDAQVVEEIPSFPSRNDAKEQECFPILTKKIEDKRSIILQQEFEKLSLSSEYKAFYEKNEWNPVGAKALLKYSDTVSTLEEAVWVYQKTIDRKYYAEEKAKKKESTDAKNIADVAVFSAVITKMEELIQKTFRNQIITLDSSRNPDVFTGLSRLINSLQGSTLSTEVNEYWTQLFDVTLLEDYTLERCKFLERRLPPAYPEEKKVLFYQKWDTLVAQLVDKINTRVELFGLLNECYENSLLRHVIFRKIMENCLSPEDAISDLSRFTERQSERDMYQIGIALDVWYNKYAQKSKENCLLLFRSIPGDKHPELKKKTLELLATFY